MEFTYLAQPPKRYTFEQPKLKKWVEENSNGKVLNLFAGTTKLNLEEVRVDIDPNVQADYHLDAFEFVNLAIDKGLKFDTIILDPPYNLRKSREKYGSRYIGSFTKIKNLLPQILNNGGVIITLGYDSVGMSKSRGFEKIGICLVCHNGDHNDTICLKERFIEEFNSEKTT
jgi:16S rRNA G966 N2-methylase RsmD